MECIKKILLLVLWPINYLFYKLYSFYVSIFNSETPPTMSHMGFLMIMLISNLITISLAVFGNVPSYNSFLIIIFILIPYAIPSVADYIVNSFSKESDRSRIIGNIAVLSYIVLSVLSLVLAVKRHLS
jgi:diacylglycerol kinase